MTRAMIVVDVQNDFVEGGSLPVIGGVAVAYRIANCIEAVSQYGLYDYFVATRDWHNPDSSNGGHISDDPDFVDTWPGHCYRHSQGSDFVMPVADVAHRFDSVFYKGAGRPDYSGFQAKNFDGEYLGEWLSSREVRNIDVVGLATDHCVRHTAIDGVLQGFGVRIPVLLTAAVGGPEARDNTIIEINKMQGLSRRIN